MSNSTNFAIKGLTDQIVVPYPPWATTPSATKLFGVGKDQLTEWRKTGVVLVRKRETSVQYRCADIDRVMTLEAKGLRPPRAK